MNPGLSQSRSGRVPWGLQGSPCCPPGLELLAGSLLVSAGSTGSPRASPSPWARLSQLSEAGLAAGLSFGRTDHYALGNRDIGNQLKAFQWGSESSATETMPLALGTAAHFWMEALAQAGFSVHPLPMDSHSRLLRAVKVRRSLLHSPPPRSTASPVPVPVPGLLS